MPDEIIKELWAIKDQSARDATYDIDKLCQRLKERDRKSTAPLVDLSRKDRHPTVTANRE